MEGQSETGAGVDRQEGNLRMRLAGGLGVPEGFHFEKWWHSNPRPTSQGVKSDWDEARPDIQSRTLQRVESLETSQEAELCFREISEVCHRTLCSGSDSRLRKLVKTG